MAAPHVILVVEDDAFQRSYALDVLEAAGYAVLEASDASEALAVLKSRRDVRLLFTDVQMPPGADGVELARRVKVAYPDVLLVVTSGGMRLRDKDLPDGGRFVPKPYRDADLLTLFAELIARPEGRAGRP